MTLTVKKIGIAVIIILFVVFILLSVLTFPQKVYADTIPSVGDSYGGGKVAYILQNGDPGYEGGKVKGLIGAPLPWSIASGTLTTSARPWALPAYQNTLVGWTGTVLWTGSDNTDKIIAQNGPGIGYSAGLARDCNNGGYNDWHLPSVWEMQKLFASGILTGGDYWTSSEIDASKAYIYRKSGAVVTYKNQFSQIYCKPVRYFTIDIAPPQGNITINSGAEYTNNTSVTLNLSATDNVGVTGYRIANGSDALGAATVPVASTTSFSANIEWTLPSGDGPKNVAVQYRDAAGNWSANYTDNIILDTIYPTGTMTINSNDTYTNTTSVTLNLSATDSNEITGYRVANGEDASGATTVAVESATSFTNDISWALDSGDGSKTVAVQYCDAAGNWSTNIADTIILDTTPPTITIIEPSDGKIYILGQVVNADWTAIDDNSGIASASGTVASGQPIETSSIGQKQFTVNATDNASNSSQLSVTYNVVYSFSGFLPPLSKVDKQFKASSALPVKFFLTDSDGFYINSATAMLFLSKINDGIPGPEFEASPKGKANDANYFRYDSKSNQYIYNVDTKSLEPGAYRLIVYLDDSTSYSIDIELK